MKRALLLMAVNLLVVITISFFLNVLGFRPYLSQRGIDYNSLLVFCAAFGFMGAFVSLQLSRFMAKKSMGVELIDPDRPRNEAERLLVGTVRDLCRKAGITTLPEIGVYPSREVNAFATGPSRDRALVAVSSGLFNAMDEQGLIGVLGHEISHVANGDMVTMTLLQGIVNTFVMFLARVGALLIDGWMRGRDDERRGGGLGYYGQWMLISLLETVLMLFAAPLVAWFSRRREFRADQGSADMLGTQTMIHSLEQLRRSQRVDTSHALVGAFKINGGQPGLLARLFSSHPPLDARIEALRRRA